MPLAVDAAEQLTGALDVHARQPGASDEERRAAAARSGPYAAVAAGDLHASRSARDTADDLQVALESRAVIDQAEGELVERHTLTPDHLVHTGELLGARPRGGDRRGPGRP